MKRSNSLLFYLAGIIIIGFFLYHLINVTVGDPPITSEVQSTSNSTFRVAILMANSNQPFSDSVKEGVLAVAEEEKIIIDFKNSLQSNYEEHKRNFEIAIASKVDGIIVEGIDDPEFTQFINKATAKGISVITIITDSPASLRKSFVGPNHYSEGKIIGEQISKQILEETSEQIEVGLITAGDTNGFIDLRKQGILNTLEKYSNVVPIEFDLATPINRHPHYEANQLLNQYPKCRIFVGLSEKAVHYLVEVINTRAKIENYSIYGFEQSQRMVQLINEGVVNTTLIQKPEEIGNKSMKLMVLRLQGNYNIPSFQYTSTKLVNSEVEEENEFD